jgi:hypothetical protein
VPPNHWLKFEFFYSIKNAMNAVYVITGDVRHRVCPELLEINSFRAKLAGRTEVTLHSIYSEIFAEINAPNLDIARTVCPVHTYFLMQGIGLQSCIAQFDLRDYRFGLARCRACVRDEQLFRIMPVGAPNRDVIGELHYRSYKSSVYQGAGVRFDVSRLIPLDRPREYDDMLVMQDNLWYVVPLDIRAAFFRSHLSKCSEPVESVPTNL